MTEPRFSNRLLHETSPYLRQHAHNPVDWYPWGEEALGRAREFDRPIFLSVGYSACHWCHVMEHESFEDEETARLLNEHFISIKVDREERPDLDQIYMTAVQIMTQQGGWPMSVFLTPDLKPFYGGTYFPPQDRYQMPSFQRVLRSVAQAWAEKRRDVYEQAGQLAAHIQNVVALEPGEGDLGPRLLQNAGTGLRRSFDPIYGGFGRAPKFPHPMELRLLLRLWKRFDDGEALDMAVRTLDHMAGGGMYDHLGGGFHRYSTDARWLVPHFEKMLYDNALLPPAYLEAYQATGNPFYRTVVEETLNYVLREMTSPEGPFYSTQDADSEGVEGKFFVWSAREIEDILGKEEAKVFASVYDVTAEGNWEGHNILNRTRSDEQEARLWKLSTEELGGRLQASKRKLLAARGRRVWPGRDDKVLTSWNGLMINALAQAAVVLDKPAYAQAACRAAAFLLGKMRTDQGRLRRTWSAGSEPKLNGYLEDYSFFIDALVSLYEATFDMPWLQAALDLTEVLCEQFWDAEEGGFFYTGRDHERLIARTKDPHDSSVPSGNSMAVTALLRLAKLTGRADVQAKAQTTLRRFGKLLESSPLAAGQMLLALDFHLGPVEEFAVIGAPAAEETRHVLRLIHQKFRPHKVVALTTAEDKRLPLLADKKALDKVTLYICRNFTCQAPLVGVEAVERALR